MIINKICAAKYDQQNNKIKEKDFPIHSNILIENIKATNKANQKIVLPQLNGFDVVKLDEIIRCQANDNFTEFYLTNGTRKLISRTLKFYEDMLREFDFIRIHKSHLINLQYVVRYLKGKGGQVEMADGSVVDVSVNRKEELLEKFR